MHAQHEPGTVATVVETEAPAEPEAAPGRWGVWVMGLVGGLVPSPSALLLLLAATALGRAWFGFVLVLAFGIGMAVSLAAVGLLARDLVLRLEGLASRRGFIGGNVRTYLRYGAAVGICAGGRRRHRAHPPAALTGCVAVRRQ